MFTNIYIYIIAFLFYFSLAYGQKPYANEVNKHSIKTLKIHETSSNLSYPVIELGSDQTISISFDDLATVDKSYQYKLIHCDADHTQSKLHPSEYISGFSNNFIEDYDYSFNTNVNYIHYSLTIPNEQTTITKSGVYALRVFENDEDSVVLTACFYVYEPLVTITPNIIFNTEKGFSDKFQQVDISIQNPNYSITNPMLETNVVVKQNNRDDNKATEIKPTFMRPNSLLYTKNKSLTFDGGNEYFYFDATTSKYSAHGVDFIDFHRPYEHFVLQPFIPNPTRSYSYNQDVNGKFIIRRQEADQDALDIESDYVFVHFQIPKKSPDFTGKLYVFGGLTLNQILPQYQMNYSIRDSRYECSVLLKQGRYEYRYLFVPKGEKRGQSSPFDTDYFETENDYQIFFYHRPLSARYDRLVGYALTNSVKY